MSALSAPTSRVRPAPVIAATVLLALDALNNLSSTAGFLSGASIPAAIVVIEVTLGVVEIIAAVGLWGLHKWAAVLATVAAALTLLVSAMGVLSATSATGKGIAALGVILSIAVIVSVALPTARRAYV